jgi:hypothetical protein
MVELTWWQLALVLLGSGSIVVEGIYRSTGKPEWWHHARWPVAVALGVFAGLSMRGKQPEATDGPVAAPTQPVLGERPDHEAARTIDDRVEDATQDAIDAAGADANDVADLVALADSVRGTE